MRAVPFAFLLSFPACIDAQRTSPSGDTSVNDTTASDTLPVERTDSQVAEGGAVCATQGLAPDTTECYTAIFDCVASTCADELATCDFGSENLGSKRCDEIQSCGRDCKDGSPSDQSVCTIARVQEGDLDARRLYAVKDLCEYVVCLEAGDHCLDYAPVYCRSYVEASHNDE